MRDKQQNFNASTLLFSKNFSLHKKKMFSFYLFPFWIQDHAEIDLRRKGFFSSVHTILFFYSVALAMSNEKEKTEHNRA